MALWDALSGKIWNWNKNKTRGLELISLNFRTWTEEFMQNARTCGESERVMETILETRDYLYSLSWSSLLFTSHELDDNLRDYKSKLMQMSPSDVVDYCCAITSFIVTVRYRENKDVWEAMMCAIAITHGKSSDYSDRWKTPQTTSDGSLVLSEETSFQLILVKEICHTLKITDANLMNPMLWYFWLLTAHSIATLAEAARQKAEYREVVDGMISTAFAQ